MTGCLVGHDSHERVLVTTGRGFRLWVWRQPMYANAGNYCTGDDVLSFEVITQGEWEREETAAAIGQMHGGWVLDFGANVGWFSMLAAQRGCSVIAWEGDPENAELCALNAAENGWADLVDVRAEWVDATTPQVDVDGPVDLVKVDLEGSDAAAVHACDTLLDARRIEALLVEVSPVFNDTYPDLVEHIAARGYDVSVVATGEPLPAKGRRPWVESCHQANLLFVRRP